MAFNRFAVAGLAATFTALIAGSAAATTPLYESSVQGTQVGPDVTNNSYFDDSNGYKDHPVSSSFNKTNVAVTATTSAANGGTVSSAIDLAPLDGFEAPDHAITAIGEADILYTFSILPLNGSADVDPINVLIQASGSVSWNNSGTPTAYFKLSNYNNYAVIIDDYISRNANGANTYIKGSDSFSTDSTFELFTNTLYSVEIGATTYSDARSFDDDVYGHVYASVDPSFTLDAADAAKYSIVGVPSDAPPPPPPPPPVGGVPEPTTWALLIAGFGLAGGRLRQRRAALLA